MKDRPTFAVFGGSFNPVHEGHLGIVRALAGDAALQGVIVVPARRSPFKQALPPLPEALRWDLLRQALRGIPRVVLSDVELRRPGPSYSVDTLRTLAGLLPDAQLQFALGWDAFADFAGWHRAAEVLELAGLIVFDRAGEPRSAAGGAGDCLPRLPLPWRERARPGPGDRLLAPDGRVLVRHWPLALPDVAAREILRTRSLEGVPVGARDALADYWAGAPRP